MRSFYLGMGMHFDLKEIRPTQLAIGYIAVEKKKRLILSMNESEREAFFKQCHLDVVLGPSLTDEPLVFLVDRHHLAKALLDLGMEDRAVYVQLADYSHMSFDAFWDTMVAQNYVYSPDIGKLGWSSNVMGMIDDVYRSAAADVRDAGRIRKVWVPFFEFEWAEFFRTNIPATAYSNYDELLEKCLVLASSSAAKHLPGYVG